VKLSLVPQERRFYDLFRRQGELASVTLAELSKSLLEGRSRQPRMRDLEHQCDEVTAEIYALANRTFVAPIEREDIVALASSLDDVVDLAEEVSDKLDLYRVVEVTDPAKAIGECLASAGVELARALDALESLSGMEAPRAEIHRLENEGDRMHREALAQLFSDDRTPATELVKWKDLYDLLEQTMDKCESVANLLFTITIKNA
jgi:uncharacterized protein Yka (UPF0111/DUF47 family)